METWVRFGLLLVVISSRSYCERCFPLMVRMVALCRLIGEIFILKFKCNSNIRVSQFGLFIAVVLELGINDLVKLEVGSNELFPYCLLNFASSTMQSKFVDLILPLDLFCEALVDPHHRFELVRQNLTELRFLDINPKGLVVTFLIILLQELVEMRETNHFDLFQHLAQEMHEMPAFKHAAVRNHLLFVENLLHLPKLRNSVNEPQF